MGRKADELREELELVEAERRALQVQNAELQDKLDRAQGLNQAELGLGPVRGPRIADEDGVEIFRAEQAAAADLQAIQELHRPPPQPDKVETSLDVVRANNAERASLQTSARLNNALISRIASALRVTTWDVDGTEILEKCQRWDAFAHWLKQRQKNATGAVANEIGTVLAALVAPMDLAKWIMDKTAETVPECAVEVAGSPVGRLPDDYLGTVTREQLLWIRNSCGFVADGPSKGVMLGSEVDNYTAAFSWLDAALKTERGTNELLALLNMVLLPFLRRMQVVSNIPVVRGN